MEPQAIRQDTPVDPDKIGKLIQGLPFEVYAASEGINSHGLQALIRSPKHYFYNRYHAERKDTKAMEFGRLFHMAVLEPDLFATRHVVVPKFDKRTKEGKTAAAAFEESLSPEAIPVRAEDQVPLLRMIDEVLAHPVASGLLKGGVREASLWWHDPEFGELAKGRFDFISQKGVVVDFKTAVDARKGAWERSMVNYGYHVQAAHYLRGARATKTANPDAFIWVVIEKEEPYEVKVFSADESVLATGEQWRRSAMKTYSECRKSGKWAGYDRKVESVGVPNWTPVPEMDDE